MSLEDLERRIQVLEDLEEIKRLKVRFAKYCDDNYNPEKLGELFTEDAVWGGQSSEEFRGKKAIIEHFVEVSRNATFTCHRVVAPDITVEGDNAHGTWYGMATGILSNGKGFWSSCLYQDEYKKVNGKWLMSNVQVSLFYRSPYEGGWAKERHMTLNVEEQRT